MARSAPHNGEEEILLDPRRDGRMSGDSGPAEERKMEREKERKRKREREEELLGHFGPRCLPDPRRDGRMSGDSGPTEERRMESEKMGKREIPSTHAPRP